MITVIFEAIPAAGKWDEYLDIAAELKPELSKIEGFISIERFQSLTNSKKVLSLSFWESEESVRQWRNLELHRAAQTKGRATVFDDYRLRVAIVERDYGMNDRAQVPPDSEKFHR
ncbi:MAG: antibiotic biosynthesis monooxygenase [Actinomycetota bacterium]